MISEDRTFIENEVNYFDYLKENYIPRNIATMSEWDNVEFYIKEFHLKKWFDLDIDKLYFTYYPEDSVMTWMTANYQIVMPYVYSHWEYENHNSGRIEGNTINYQNYTNNGLNAIGNIFPSNGILVYHIDSSVTYESKYEGYTINNNNTTYTNKNGYGTRNNLIEFVPYSSSSNIYKANADLNKTLKDNKGNTIPHTFHIDNISGDTATLTFKKL